MACFSCYPTKNLGAIGDAGLIVTKSTKLFKNATLRQYGWNQEKMVTEPGYNSRLDEVQAAILNVKIKYLDKDNNKRRTIAAYYNKHISNNKFIKPKIRKDTIPVYHLYVLQCEERNKFINYMKNNKILCGIHYPIPNHKHKGFEKAKIFKELRITEKICKRVVSLPMYPELKMKDVKYITKIINKF